MKITIVTFAALLWLSCYAQVHDDGIGDVILMLQATMDLLFDQKEKISNIEAQNENLSSEFLAQSLKITTMEEHLKALSDSQKEQQVTLQSGLQNMTQEILNSTAIEHNEMLPPLQKLSGFLDLVSQNECINGNHQCSEFAECIDSAFHYRCSCFDGYSGDGFQCIDINECLNNPCDPEAECRNSKGNFTCACKEPYEGDGHTCKFNCQSIGAIEVGTLGCLKIVHTKMTWEESRSECESQGMRLLEDIPNRQKFRDIWNALGYDSFMWIGGKSRRWITSGDVIDSQVYWKDQPDGDLDECIRYYAASTTTNEGLNDKPCTAESFPLCQFLTT